MDSIIRTDKVTMINLRGGLREVQSSNVPALKELGWKLVVNAKRDYYPELDQASQNHSMNSNNEIDDELESENLLKFEDV